MPYEYTPEEVRAICAEERLTRIALARSIIPRYLRTLANLERWRADPANERLYPEIDRRLGQEREGLRNVRRHLHILTDGSHEEDRA